MVRINAHVNYTMIFEQNASKSISIIPISFIFYDFHKNFYLFLSPKNICIFPFPKMHVPLVFRRAIGCFLYFLQLNTFFISFHFFSSQFQYMIKVQTKQTVPTLNYRRVSKYNTFLFHFSSLLFCNPRESDSDPRVLHLLKLSPAPDPSDYRKTSRLRTFCTRSGGFIVLSNYICGRSRLGRAFARNQSTPSAIRCSIRVSTYSMEL